jgi:hypothetical protein
MPAAKDRKRRTGDIRRRAGADSVPTERFTYGGQVWAGSVIVSDQVVGIDAEAAQRSLGVSRAKVRNTRKSNLNAEHRAGRQRTSDGTPSVEGEVTRIETDPACRVSLSDVVGLIPAVLGHHGLYILRHVQRSVVSAPATGSSSSHPQRICIAGGWEEALTQIHASSQRHHRDSTEARGGKETHVNGLSRSSSAREASSSIRPCSASSAADGSPP